MRISTELFQEMLNRSISVVCPVRSMVNYDQFQTTDHVRICCGCVPASTVIYGLLLLQSVAVDYGRNEIFEHVENRAAEKSRCRKRAGCRSIPEHHGHVYGPGTNIPQTLDRFAADVCLSWFKRVSLFHYFTGDISILPLSWVTASVLGHGRVA